ncbi:hypothetical protein [Histidinibacterium lentulum]|uniref:Uncharacterized protein n=1 Tax=Histidinibacterium lentulum TaxID=2480588 RepID=A0A3N2QWC9_9RHOB|nr:hypothetical protein [Histidinibacterium lentulum]ROT99365.1 hypothetical protein EAT49_14185 [Histidinibacterium lentulum]
MSEPDPQDRSPLAASSRPIGRGLSAVEIGAAALGVIWLLFAGTAALRGPSEAGGDPLRPVLGLLAVALPLAVIWVGAMTYRSARIVRSESARLQAAVDALRKTYVEERQQRGAGKPDPALERRLGELVQEVRALGAALARPPLPEESRTAVRAAAAETPEEAQPALGLVSPEEATAPPIAIPDLIRALNFPDTAEDSEGFAALRLALQNRWTRQLVQASQDVLTLMSQDGIYMDDLRPDPARPEIWRRFAAGERGRAVAALGGVRDRRSLEIMGSRMREDTIFRDAAHHFLRRFDQMLVEFDKAATDEEILAMADTRTARAFMLLGRAMGTFD